MLLTVLVVFGGVLGDETMGQCATSCREDTQSDTRTGSRKDIVHQERKTMRGPSSDPSPITKSTLFPQVHRKDSSDVQSNGTMKKKVGIAPSEKSGLGLPGTCIGPELSSSKIEQLFGRYRDQREDAILAEGMERFCNDLCVDPMEFVVLVIAWKFKAAMMCRFTRKEFVTGCTELRSDTIKGIQASFPGLLDEVRGEEAFRDLYRFTFQFGLDSEQGQRSLPRDTALALWRLVYTQAAPAILARWLDFLGRSPSVRGVSRDTWNMFLTFSQAMGPDLSTYSEDEAWPSLFDAFVEWEVERRREGEGPPPDRQSQQDVG